MTKHNKKVIKIGSREITMTKHNKKVIKNILYEDPKIAVERFEKIRAEAEALCIEWTELVEKKKLDHIVFLTAIEMMNKAKEQMTQEARAIVDADTNLRIQISEQANAMTREFLKRNKK